MRTSFLAAAVLFFLVAWADAADMNLLPNGGFEICGHLGSTRLAWQTKAGMTFDSPDPLLPLRWVWWSPNAPVDLRISSDAHGGKNSLRYACPKAGLTMEMQIIEVVPGATYSFGGWAKGKGQGRIAIQGNAYEGRKEIGGVDLPGKTDWTEARGKVTIPGNVRSICFALGVNGADPMLIDDLFFSADVEKPYDVDAVMTTKFKKDEHTLLLVDFDGQGEYRLESKATLTDDKGGRFGKGARLDEFEVSSLVMPLAIKEMPAEGTLEFWFSPDSDPTRPLNYMTVLSGEQEILYFGTGDTLNVFWPGEDNKYRSVNWCDPHANHVWIQKGQWHHVAMEWDKEAVRLYVDGALAAMSTARPLPLVKLPSALKMGASWPGNAWSGVVDEIRVSNIKRYGPVIPVGATWRPLPVAAAPQEAAKAAPAPASSAPDFAKERKSLIGAIPPAPAGAISFDATQVKPLVQDDKDFEIQPDTPIKGMTVARVSAKFIELGRTPDYDGGYWTLKGVSAGKYYVGIWYESNTEGLEAPQQYYGRIFIYLNGRVVQMSTHSEPVQVAPGVYYVEAQSKTAEPIKDGDEIEVLGQSWQPVRVARLTLHSQEPARGHGWMFENYGHIRDRSLRLIAYCGYRMAEGKGFWNRSSGMDNECDSPDSLKKTADGKALAYYWVANPLTVPLTVKCKAEIRAYYREIVGSQEVTVELMPHQRVTMDVPFTLPADSRRYSMNVNVEAVDPPALDRPKVDTIDFFKGVRQSVPWHDPFSNEFRRCMSFRQPVAGVRQDISLSGKWESAFTPVPTAPPFPPPADLKWQERDVPFTLSGWNEKPPAHSLYVRRKVTLPADAMQRTWRLLVGPVNDEATAYVNGTKVGNVRGAHTPILCDVSNCLRPGENEILIVIRDALAVMDPAYVNPNNPTVTNQYLDAPGQGYACGFAIYSGVRLISSPMVTAEDLQVVTSVRKKTVSARFNVTNREKSARKLTIKTSVLDAGKPVMDVGQATVEVPPYGSKPVDTEAAWAEPVLWGPASPKLYTLAVEVTDSATGQKLDLLRERFGFRECWIENGRIMLNGVPVRLKGSNCGGGGGTVGGDDVQWTRGSDGMEDFLDEFGCLTGLYTLGGLCNTPSRHNIERDVYWEFEKKNVLAGAAQYVNHPCLIAWDLSNEWLGYCSYGGGDPLFGARRFKTVGEALMAYDPSRWIIFDGDGDLMGLWNTQADHYMIPWGNNDMRGHSGYLPDSRFWRRLDQDFDPAEARSGYNHQVVYRTDKKVVMNTENSWKVDGLQPPGLSFVLNEDDVLGPALDSGRGAALWYWKQNVDGHRDMGASIVCNYTMITGLNYRGHMIQCFIMAEHSHHYFSGQKVNRRYSLHNDLLVRSDYDFHWSLVDSRGTVLAENHDKRRMDSGDLQRGELDLEMPKVNQRTLYTLRLELLADGKFAYGEERDIEVWPDTIPTLPALTRKISLFDPSGKTAGIFKKAGIGFATMETLAAPEGKPSETVLVLGEGAVTAGKDAAGDLSAFTSAGGRVVVLMQNKLLPNLPVRTTLEPHEWCSMTFLRTPQHPILKGLDSWDLQFWSPDHVLAEGSYLRPDEGSFVSLIDGAGDHDRGSRSAMDWNQLMECYRGQGSYLLCQLPLIEKYDAEPMAREMLARIIAYEDAGTPFRTPGKTLAVAGDSAGPAVTRLRDMGVQLQMVDANSRLGEDSVLLADAATLSKDFAAPQAWKDALAQGATIVVHGATPDQKPLLEALAGKTIQMTVQPYAMWEGRGCRNGFTWLTAGLSHIDLYWKDYDGSEGGVWQAEQPKLKIEDICYWSITADGAVEHIYPGMLVEIPVGKGKLIVDQIRWETTNKKLDRLTIHVASALMTAMNIGIAPYVPPRKLPNDVVYKPVDLSAFCNRGFKDDAGDDGKGGWPDQGPKADLHEFPTGESNLGGVPYSIGKEPRTCIVLKSGRRPFPELYPDEATIPLGFKVEGLFFLHSTSWGGQEPTGRYQIQYADGTVAEITLVEGENIFGWNRAPGEFPRERGTQSHVVWTGSCELFPSLVVCQMLWVNPKPDVAIKAVRFSNPTPLCPVLIGVTAAVKPGKTDIDAIAAAQTKARECLKKAITAADAGKDIDARAALQEAIKADPKLDAAYQRLCELEDRGHDEKAILAAYKAWAASGARTPLPYNKIGQMLERQGDLKGALDAYTKSLAVEWNQPPTIEAKSRLTLQLKK
jgi:hypothetical protein